MQLPAYAIDVFGVRIIQSLSVTGENKNGKNLIVQDRPERKIVHA